jgi:hypothetical protein
MLVSDNQKEGSSILKASYPSWGGKENAQRRCDPLYVAGVLFYDVIEILGLGQNEVSFSR